MGKVYGIDLGTTYSAIATLDAAGVPEVIENFYDSGMTLASAVYFPPDGSEPVFGVSAKNQAEVEPDRVVQYIKREIGKPDGLVREFNGQQYDPILISALILKRIADYAREQGHDVKDVVITCPAYFGIEECNATRQAGQIAGFNVMNIVHEPTAAALNYCCREFVEDRKVMVYDLGGGTFDITLFEMTVSEERGATLNVIDFAGNDRLGGVDWDDRLFDYVAGLYCDDMGISVEDMDAELRQIIRVRVEELKKDLTNLRSKAVTINYNGASARPEVTREKFEEITLDLLTQTTDLVQQVLAKTGVAAQDVDMVLLVGGSSKMPMVKAAVDAIFPGRVRIEQPELAVVKGAALAAAIAYTENPKAPPQMGEVVDEIEPGKPGVEGNTPVAPPVKFEEILSRSFGVGTMDESDRYILDNLVLTGAPSPADAQDVYGPVVDDQPAVLFRIFENTSQDKTLTPCVDIDGNEQYTDPALHVKLLGELRLPLPPNTPARTPILVQFHCSTMGLDVTALNQTTGESQNTVIEFANSGKSAQEVERLRQQLGSIKTRGDI